jgi:predicted RNA binding protein YcfA (HicA-like mRNA interferase family)
MYEKEFKDIRKRLVKMGYDVQQGRGRKGGHFIVTHPDGTYIATLPTSPGDYRALPNTLSTLYKKGIDLRKRDSKRKTKRV